MAMNQPATAVQTPNVMGPEEWGARMAQLREQFNLSHQEVSERLHIRMRYIGAIEEAKYDQMPGKVYARGYVHTYAEFLGLNADEVVTQCFAGELPSNAQPIPPIAAARYSSPAARSGISMSSKPSPWRGILMVGALALIAVLVVSQFMGHGSDAPKQEEATAVAPVPEAMLDSMRTMVMPLPENYDCLTDDDAYLTCFEEDDAAQLMGHLDADRFWYGGAMEPTPAVAVNAAETTSNDEAVAPLAEAPAAPVEEKPVAVEPPVAADKPATENPDSPSVATAPSGKTDSKPEIKPDVEDGQNATPPHDE